MLTRLHIQKGPFSSAYISFTVEGSISKQALGRASEQVMREVERKVWDTIHGLGRWSVDSHLKASLQGAL